LGCSGCEGFTENPPRPGEGDHAQHGGGAREVITGPTETLRRARKLRSEMSLPETILWRELRKRPSRFKFRRQHPAGRYILDFYCASAKLAIEVDGHSHDGHVAARADAVRGDFLRSQGVATLRVPVSAVLGNLEGAVLRIVEVCEARVVKLAERRGRDTLSVPLHHPLDGPPPRAGEEL
jgi:very-short-patch-repair endonuclease